MDIIEVLVGLFFTLLGLALPITFAVVVLVKLTNIRRRVDEVNRRQKDLGDKTQSLLHRIEHPKAAEPARPAGGVVRQLVGKLRTRKGAEQRPAAAPPPMPAKEAPAPTKEAVPAAAAVPRQPKPTAPVPAPAPIAAPARAPRARPARRRQ